MNTVGELRKYLKKSDRSPEAVALEFHVSHMTIRRLLRKTDSAHLPEKYQILFTPYASCEKILRSPTIAYSVSEKVDPPAEPTISQHLSSSFSPALFSDPEKPDANDPALNALGQSDGFKKVLSELTENGSKVNNPEELKSAYDKKIKTENFGKEMLTALREVAEYAFRGSSLSLRLMCIGALLYFVNVFDLIPDTLGPIGYLDDFAVVALVAGQIKKERQRLRIAPGVEAEILV